MIRGFADKQLYNAMFVKSPVCMAFVRPNGEIEEANESLASFLGYSVNELKGMNFAKITHPSYLYADQDMFNELVEGKRNHYQMDKKYITALSQSVSARLDVFSLYSLDEDGKKVVDLLYGVVRPIQVSGEPQTNEEDVKRMFEAMMAEIKPSLIERGAATLNKLDWKVVAIIGATIVAIALVLSGNADIIGLGIEKGVK